MLEGKVALITGGSRGIGAAIVRKFVSEGAHVAFTYHSSATKAKELINECAALGDGTVRAYQSDASSFDASQALIADVVADFEKLDVLINNAGITRDNLMLRMSEEQWDEVMSNNLKSVFNLTKQVIKPMMKARGGSIINVGSVVGVFGNAGQANYAASKAGVIGFSKSIAKEVGSRNIRCNVVAPGFIETDMTDKLPESVIEQYQSSIPLKRLGHADEVANLCLFLASDMSAYITGQVLSVCGGLNT